MIKRHSQDCLYFDPFNINFMYYQRVPKLTLPNRKSCENQATIKRRIIHIAKTTVSLSFSKIEMFRWSKALEILCEELAQLISTKENLTFILYNDLRWHHAIVVQVCKDLGIRYFVFERGAIRGKSISCDTLGVNARSNFYLNNHEIVPKNIEFDFETLRKTKKNIELQFAYHLMHRIIANYKFGIPKVAGRSNLIIDYCYRYARQVFQSKWKRNSDTDKYHNHYLVALQLEYDSQIVFGSNYSSNQEFIDDVIDVFRSSSTQIIFKSHPHDNKNYNYHGLEKTSEPTPDLLAKVKGVVTINSTVGFEALHANLPVMCFGKSFYTLNNYVYSQNELAEFLKAKSSKNNYQDLVSLLAGNYLYPGDIYNFNSNDIVIVSDTIFAHVCQHGR